MPNRLISPKRESFAGVGEGEGHGRVSNVSPVLEPGLKIGKWTLSILTNLPTWISLVGSIEAGVFALYTVVPSLDATIDITIRPVPAVAEGFGDCETSSSFKTTPV